MPKKSHIDFMRPYLVEDIEYIRNVTDCKVKTRQFMEHTGIHCITEKNGVTILKVMVSGLRSAKDVTHTIILLAGQKDCPLDKVEINTDSFDAYTDGNIEPGTRKIIEVEYMTDRVVFEEKKVRHTVIEDEVFVRVFDPIDCDNGIPVHPVDFDEIERSAVYLINKGRTC